jgi:hypothetical protein
LDRTKKYFGNHPAGINFYSLWQKETMENENKFPEQKAPEKNTDDAFVEVGQDGSPVQPAAGQKEKADENEEKATTLDKR